MSVSQINNQKALEGFEEMKQKRSLADVTLDYARMARKGAEQGAFPTDLAGEYFNKARTLFEELRLPHKVKECV